jgi:HPt (histidine-containing phosphotransfer) domain-containing protein
MSKKKTEDSVNEQAESASKIEAIKNLIFGENIIQYDSEFETLKQDLENKKKQLESYIDEVRNELMQSIDSLSTDVNIRITDLEDAINTKTDALSEKKVDRKELGKLLVSLGEKISS